VPSCPKCGENIATDFGMVNCPGCNTMLSVNFDGSVDISDDVESNAVEPNPDANEFIEHEDSFSQPPAVVDPQHRAEDFIEDAGAFSEENSFISEDNEVAEEVLPSEEQENIFESEEQERSQSLDNPDFSDVEEYANSELSSSQVGGILYDLHITGIDNSTLKEEIRLELIDKRYRLDVSALLDSIQDGKMTIRGLNAAKAAMIVNRLKHLDIEMQWKQNEVIRM